MAHENDFLRKLRATFQLEAGEHLQEISSNLVLLEGAHAAAQRELVDRVLKRLHTLKGAARAVNLTDLETLCHGVEEVFSAILQAGSELSAAQFDAIHQAAELARSLTSEPTGRVRNQAAAMMTRLGRLSKTLKAATTGAPDAAADSKRTPALAPATPAVPMAPDSPATDTALPVLNEVETWRGGVVERQSANADYGDVITVQGKSLDAVRYQAESFLATELSLNHQIDELLALADELSEECARLRTSGLTSAIRRTEPGDSDGGAYREASRSPDRAFEKRIASTSNRPATRAQPNLLANLIDNAEARCRKAALGLSRAGRHFAASRAKLMDAALATALVPFGSALEPLSATVRNLARSRGKQASLVVEGESVRVDRRILAVARDVLLHLVTNAVDHGIEPVEQRLAAGKAASGTVRLGVSQTGGNEVLVTVTDDGAGIDLSALVDAALRQGMLQAEQIETLSDTQKRQLALRSGLSTSKMVTQVSGRGVGLAIVAEQIASVGGRLEVDSDAGTGSTFQLFLPVRLATLRGLVLRVGPMRYVTPLNGVDSVVALKLDDIQTVENCETLVVHGRVVPAIRLRTLLRAEEPALHEEVQGEKIAVIARAGQIIFAMLVDEVVAEQEVLPKKLGKQLKRVRYVAGATQLGDGGLVPILNLEDVADFGVVPDAGQRRRREDDVSTKRMLVVEDSITSRLLLKHILEGAGYQVDTAVDGLDALSKLRQEEFDAVISDIEMPQLDGLRLTERIRSDPKTEELPVILVTSLQSAEEKARGLHAGADAYIVKGSFDQDNLLATIRRLT
jgi:two-component system chemotaxis sensor kinase CheA